VLGFSSVLSIRLFTPVRRLGALNLYGRSTGAFSPADTELALIFGRHASVALTSAQNGDSLRAAVASRHLIGQAQGILMERYQVDADRAFDILRRYSQHQNIKLRVIAEQVITHHRLPD
jgi:GAF domain-containing protein